MDSRHYCSRNGCGSLAESGTKRCSEHTANMTLRERCEKAWFDNEMDSIDGIEAFAREIRNEALEEAAKLADSFGEKRTRQLVGLVSGAAHTIAQDIRTHALAASAEGEKA